VRNEREIYPDRGIVGPAGDPHRTGSRELQYRTPPRFAVPSQIHDHTGRRCEFGQFAIDTSDWLLLSWVSTMEKLH
jgi:hypothetical protein